VTGVELPETFTLADVRAAGLSTSHFYRLRDKGEFEAISRGLYRRTETPWGADNNLIEIAAKSRMATLCLTTALARHGLTDEIPATIDVALPRGARRPVVTSPVTWHAFASLTFDVGRERIDLEDGLQIGLYNAPRSIIDAFRLRHREGNDVAFIALRRWLRRRGNHPAELMEMAKSFPKAVPSLRAALEVLLSD
jgi:hypothetical protein